MDLLHHHGGRWEKLWSISCLQIQGIYPNDLPGDSLLGFKNLFRWLVLNYPFKHLGFASDL